jgi:hypothetical protein
MNSFEVYHTSSGSTYGKKMESKLLEHFGTFPREMKTIQQDILQVRFKRTKRKNVGQHGND